MRASLQPWSPAEYHTDPCEGPSLSASIATTLVTQSPLHAWSKHPRMGARRTPPTPSMDEGSLIHALLLGVGDIKEIPFDNYSTKKAKEARDAAIADGALPVKARDLDHAKEVSAKLRAGMAAFGIELTGRSEQAMTWIEQSAYGDIEARGMMDHVFVDEGRIIDLKKISSADEHTCANHAYRYGYDIQAAAYKRGLSQIVPSLAGRITYMWLFLEIELPLALPVIVAGLRIAAVTVIGLVTVTALLGRGGLGSFILTGFRLPGVHPTMIIVGTALSVVLAIVLDLLLLGVERALTPWARRRATA
jgi:hypothetical protein